MLRQAATAVEVAQSHAALDADCAVGRQVATPTQARVAEERAPNSQGHGGRLAPSTKAAAVGVEAARRPSMEAVADSVDAAAAAVLLSGAVMATCATPSVGAQAVVVAEQQQQQQERDEEDGARMHLYPLRVAELYELLLLKELKDGGEPLPDGHRSTHPRADPHLVEYLREEAPLHPPRPAPPSSTAAAPTVDEEMQRAVELYGRSHASIARARKDQQEQSSSSALLVVDGDSSSSPPPQVLLLDLPHRRPGRIVATTANLRCLDVGRYHLSARALEAIVRLVPLCVNLEHLGLQQQSNAAAEEEQDVVLRPLCGTIAVSHPTLTSLDLTGTFVGWEDLRALHRSMQRNVRLQAVAIDHALCETPPTLRRKFAAQGEFNARAMANAAVTVRGSFVSEPFVTGLRHVTRDDLARIFVPWQV